MLKRVLVPLGSHESTARTVKLFEFLKSLGTESAVLLHVGANKGGGGRNNRQYLEKHVEELKKIGIEAEADVRAGSVQLEIVQAAKEHESDYICMPFRRKNWLGRAILGSTVKDVIRQSVIPVFVYKESTFLRSESGMEGEVFRVLYPTSLQWRDDIIVSYIRNNEFKAGEVDFLHIGRRAPDPVVEQQRRDRVEEQLSELQNKCGMEDKESEYIMTLGSPRRQIVRMARKYSVDLVLLGKADSVSGREPVLGSTAEEVSYNAPCSVLIIPRDVQLPGDKKAKGSDRERNSAEREAPQQGDDSKLGGQK